MVPDRRCAVLIGRSAIVEDIARWRDERITDGLAQLIAQDDYLLKSAHAIKLARGLARSTKDLVFRVLLIGSVEEHTHRKCDHGHYQDREREHGHEDRGRKPFLMRTLNTDHTLDPFTLPNAMHGVSFARSFLNSISLDASCTHAVTDTMHGLDVLTNT